MTLLGYDDDAYQVHLGPDAWPLGVYILGVTRMGKSTLMEEMICQDIKAGTPGLFLDPHRDSIDHILARLPEKDAERVVSLDLLDETHTFGLSPFACSNPGSRLAVAETVERVLNVFEALWGNLFDTPTLEGFLRNSTLALVAHPGSRMRDIRILLQPRRFQDEWERLIAPLKNSFPESYDFWQEFVGLNARDQSQLRRSTFTRADRFTGDPLVSDVVDQLNPPFNLRRLLSEGKFIFVKLSRQHEQATRLVGALFIAQMLEAALARSNVPEEERTPWHLYADEVGSYATSDFADLFTQTGKYRVYTVAAHQDRSQVKSPQVRSALLGAGTRIAFRLIRADAEEIAPTFDTYREGPPIQRVKTRPATTIVTEEVWEPPEAYDQWSAVFHKKDEVGKLCKELFHILCECSLGSLEADVKAFIEKIQEPDTNGRLFTPLDFSSITSFPLHVEDLPWYDDPLPIVGQSYTLPADYPLLQENYLNSSISGPQSKNFPSYPLLKELADFIASRKLSWRYTCTWAGMESYMEGEFLKRSRLGPLPSHGKGFCLSYLRKVTPPGKWYKRARTECQSIHVYFAYRKPVKVYAWLRKNVLPILLEYEHLVEEQARLASCRKFIRREKYLGYDIPTKSVRRRDLYGSGMQDTEDNDYIWEKGQPISPTQVAGEIANQLERLEQFECRIQVQEGRKKVDHILYPDPPFLPEQTPERLALIEGIWQQSRQRYCLPRVIASAVEGQAIPRPSLWEEPEESEVVAQPTQEPATSSPDTDEVILTRPLRKL